MATESNRGEEKGAGGPSTNRYVAMGYNVLITETRGLVKRKHKGVPFTWFAARGWGLVTRDSRVVARGSSQCANVSRHRIRHVYTNQVQGVDIDRMVYTR